MGAPLLRTPMSEILCTQCGNKLVLGARFCNKCGSAAPKLDVRPQDFERYMRVAWSCFKDVENKIEDIQNAKRESDQAVNEGSFRDTIARTAIQGRLENEFHDNLNMAWNSALTATQLDPDGHLEIEGLAVTPKTIMGGVCFLRGELGFALEKWDEAIGFYNQAIQYFPDNPAYHYNLAACYTNKHNPELAMAAFQKVIDLDPIGEEGIQATKNLEKLRTGKIGQKGFQGSWIVLLVLSGLIFFSLLATLVTRGLAIIWVLIWGGVLFLYWKLKYR